MFQAHNDANCLVADTVRNRIPKEADWSALHRFRGVLHPWLRRMPTKRDYTFGYARRVQFRLWPARFLRLFSKRER